MKVNAGLGADLGKAGVEARRAEEWGYDGVSSAETQHDPFLPLALAAEHTQRIRLGTAIAVAFARSPATLAYTAWDLADASRGRFILGLGTQVKAHVERRFGMPWPDSPAGKLRDMIQAMRALWRAWQEGERLNHRGPYHKLTLMSPFFNPGPIEHPRIPVYIAGVNRHMCRIAGEVCNGLHVHPFNSPKYLREYVHPAVEEGLRASGRRRADFTYVTSTFAVVGDTEQELERARQSVRQQIAFYASTRTYEPVLAAHGWQDLTPALHRKSVEGDWVGMAALISDEMVDTFAVTGTYATLGAKIKERYAGLLDRTSLYQPWQPGLDDLRLPRLIKEFN